MYPWPIGALVVTAMFRTLGRGSDQVTRVCPINDRLVQHRLRDRPDGRLRIVRPLLYSTRSEPVQYQNGGGKARAAQPSGRPARCSVPLTLHQKQIQRFARSGEQGRLEELALPGGGLGGEKRGEGSPASGSFTCPSRNRSRIDVSFLASPQGWCRGYVRQGQRASR